MSGDGLISRELLSARSNSPNSPTPWFGTTRPTPTTHKPSKSSFPQGLLPSSRFVFLLSFCFFEIRPPSDRAWFYLQMHENYASLAWTTTPDHAAQLLKLEDKAFVHEINNHLQHRLKLGGGTLGKALQSVLFRNRPSSSRFSKKRPHRFLVDNGITVPLVESIEGSRISYPLRLLHAAEYVRPRFALIGSVSLLCSLSFFLRSDHLVHYRDAAHVVHPMAGQGVNMGFADVTSLANTVIHSLESGLDIGSSHHPLHFAAPQFQPTLLLIKTHDQKKKKR